MLELILCRGIPASGKSTFAKLWVTTGENRVRVNRDDIRMQFFNRPIGVDENFVTRIEDACIRESLKAGKSVIVDATNIGQKYAGRFVQMAQEFGAKLSVKEFPVDLDTAIRRNEWRAEKGFPAVPENVVRRMYRQYEEAGPLDLSVPEYEKYQPSYDLPQAIMVDIDGTLAHMNGRSPYEWHRVYEDSVDEAVRAVVNILSKDFYILVLSGRDAVCFAETENWLTDNGISFDALIMRPEGDTRKDSIVKMELFDEHVRGKFDVAFVLDDRQQVVDMWRALGLKCFQVAPGNF